MPKFKVFPYKISSNSARILAAGLNTICVFPNRNYTQHRNHVVINWGNSNIPDWNNPFLTVLNKYESVANAINKISCFQILDAAGVRVPKYTTNYHESLNFLADNGIIVCRTVVTGRRGAGIVLAKTADDVVLHAPLYTRHVRHKTEYRVFVVKDKVIDVVEKRKRRGVENINSLIRNAGDWVFCRDGIQVPDDVIKQALDAIQALQLDFGAVDVAYRVRDDLAYVLEVNTAPGFESDSTTASSFINAFKELV